MQVRKYARTLRMRNAYIFLAPIVSNVYANKTEANKISSYGYLPEYQLQPHIYPHQGISPKHRFGVESQHRHVRFRACFASSNTHQFSIGYSQRLLLSLYQCIWQEVKSLGFQQWYQGDSELRHAICKTAAIAFVPVHFVYVAWDGVAQELDEIEELEDFKDYFESTWMRGQYPCIIWNFFFMMVHRPTIAWRVGTVGSSES